MYTMVGRAVCFVCFVVVLSSVVGGGTGGVTCGASPEPFVGTGDGPSVAGGLGVPVMLLVGRGGGARRPW